MDTSDGIVASLELMQDIMCKKTLSEETLRKFIGPPLKESFMKYYEVPLEETEEMTRVYRECYLKVGINRTRIFEGTIDFLQHIRATGGKSAVATLKQHQLASMTLHYTKIDEIVDYIALDLENSLGDKAALIRQCLRAMNCGDYARAVMIGDSPFDGYAAAEAGVAFLPMTGGEGFQQPGSLDGLDYVGNARSPQELCDLIYKMI